MRNCAIATLCILSSSVCVAQAQQPKRLTAEEIERELAIVEAYLARDGGDPWVNATPGESAVAGFSATSVVQNIDGLAADSPLRLEAIALARKYAAIPEYAIEPDLRKQKRPKGVNDRQAHTRLYFAWGVLMGTGILRDGMRLEELVALLGQPTKLEPEMAEWYYSSGMHVNPCLRYWRLDGQEKRAASNGRATNRTALQLVCSRCDALCDAVRASESTSFAPA
jgi:hypothetical protein